MKKRMLDLAVLVAVCAATAAAGTSLALGGRSGAGVKGVPPASSFSARVDNQWFPLEPGTRYVYTGVKDGKPSRDVVTVTHRTKTIAGVRCVAVHDRLYLGGRLGERTTDWYSQDARGNVWYFGEDTAELDAHGNVTSTEGTWAAGAHGAKAGLFMPASPRVGQSYRQEYSKGHAEDHFKVIGVMQQVAGTRNANTLLTQEWTPLEPDVIDHKLYVRGIGTVWEQTEKGGDERNELVSITRGHD